jgi:carbon monoxide dehydrogenase subunit G
VQLEQSFDLPVERDQVWLAFCDVSMLVSCLPGARLTSEADADPLRIVFSVKLGPISASFGGEGHVVYNDGYSGGFSGSGADRKTNSRVKGEARFSLHEVSDGTRVRIAVDYALTGTLAQFGRPGIVKEIAANLTQQFAANLRTRLAQDAVARTAGDPAAPLDAGGLLVKAAGGRIKRLFGSKDE